MARPVAEAKDVVKDPDVCGGDPTLQGTRIRVSDVVEGYEHRGLSPEEIVGELSSLTLADVFAALTYYHEHPEEIREELGRRADRADAGA